MLLPSFLRVFDSSRGDITLNAQQAAAIGAAFGNGAAQFDPNNITNTIGDDGNLFVQTVSAGRSPGSTGNDNVLAAFSIPAAAFDIANRGVNICAYGSIVNNANAKRLKIIVGCTAAVVGQAVSGGTAIADTASVTTVGGGFSLQANLFKYGAAGSNTQIAIHEASQIGSTVQSLIAPSLLTLNEAAPILCALTGNAGTATSDIVFNFLQAFAMN
jgi:hypothetical protein